MQVDGVRLAYNTAYLVTGPGGERVLVDTGPDYSGARDILAEALNGRLPGLVLATHGHVDHAGLGRWWQERGVPVALGAADAHLAREPQLSSRAEFEQLAAFVQASGAPEEVAAEAIAGLERRRSWARQVSGEAAYPPGGRPLRWPTGLRYDTYEPAMLIAEDSGLPAGLRALISPGHTPGNLVAWCAAEGWLFSGDQLLPDLTPTPAIQSDPRAEGTDWRFRSLPAFVESLRRLRALQPARCFPGHGEPFDAVGAAIEANLRAIEQRTERVASELLGLGPATLYGLSERLYPRAVRRRYWQIVATVLGHLDLLAEVGRAREDGGRWSAMS